MVAPKGILGLRQQQMNLGLIAPDNLSGQVAGTGAQGLERKRPACKTSNSRALALSASGTLALQSQDAGSTLTSNYTRSEVGGSHS